MTLSNISTLHSKISSFSARRTFELRISLWNREFLRQGKSVIPSRERVDARKNSVLRIFFERIESFWTKKFQKEDPKPWNVSKPQRRMIMADAKKLDSFLTIWVCRCQAGHFRSLRWPWHQKEGYISFTAAVEVASTSMTKKKLLNLPFSGHQSAWLKALEYNSMLELYKL